MSVVPIRSAIVLGSNGGFGRILARRLIDSGVSELHGMDLQPASTHDAITGEYLQGAAAQPDEGARRLLTRVDCVLACVPEDVVVQALPLLNELMSPDKLVVDIASVKGPIAAAYQSHGCSVGHVGLHPMFAPVPDFSGRGMAMVILRANGRSAAFGEMVRSWGVDPCVLSAAQHDEVTASVQALPHAALIAFGATLASSGVPFETMWKLATPIHKSMLGLLYRVTGRDRAVHFSIQADNQNAAQARQRLQEQVAGLSAQVGAGDCDGFCEELRQIYTWMAPAEPQIRAIAEGIVGLTRVESSSGPGDPAILGIE